jgi:hypothetical protein
VSTGVSGVTIDQLAPQDRGLSSLHQGHVLNFCGMWSPRWQTGNIPLDQLLNNWKVAMSLRVGSGRPFSVTATGENDVDGRFMGDLNNDGYAGDRVFGRNILTGPVWFTHDLRLSRVFPLPRNWKVEAIFEVFNLFNHTNYYTPESITVYTVRNGHELHYDSGNFAFSTRNQFNTFSFIPTAEPRQIQVGVKIHF